MATMRQVAALANVSAKTVSRVFNNDPHVTPETKERVESALRELSYVPNAFATTFRNGRSPVVAIAVPDVVDPFFASVAKAADTLAALHGMSIVVTNLGDDAEREPDIVQSLLSQAPSGLIIAPVALDHHYLSAWTKRLPVVFVDRQPVGVAADSFIEDDRAGAHLATSHLIGHGHKRIAFIGDDLSVPTTRGRFEGYRAALSDAGLGTPDDLIAFGAFDRSGAAAAYQAIDHADPVATGLFCSNARAAMSLVPVLASSGLAVTSFGGFPLADMITPSLTVIDQDPHRLGTLAAQRVLDRLAQPARRYRRRTVLPVELIERDSCSVTTRIESIRLRRTASR